MKKTRLLVPVGLGFGLSMALLLGIKWQSGLANGILYGVAYRRSQSEVTTRYVAKTGVDQGDCTDSSAPCSTVQYAVDWANDGDEVRLAGGVYTDVNGLAGHDQVVFINKTLSLRGGYTLTNWTTPDFSSHLTVLNAQSLGRVVYITGSITATLEGLRLTGGTSGSLVSWDPGGGIFIADASVTISDCEIISNTSQDSGGGLFLAHSSAYLNNNTFRANVAPFGGGIHSDSSVIRMSSNALINNVANDNAGGGAFFKYSHATLQDNIIRGNHSNLAGGGLAFDEDGEAILISNTIEANSSMNFGGGVAFTSIGDAELLTNTIQENTAAANGGGVFQEFGELKINGNVIVSNTADGSYGGGIYAAFDTISVSNNFLHDNYAWQGGGFYLYYSNAVIEHNAITENTADHMGGGAYLLDTPATLGRNLIAGNITTISSGWGGGMVLDGSNVTMTNNLFFENKSAGLGSGLLVDRVNKGNLMHNTIAHNNGSYGDGLFLASNSHFTLTNTILVGQNLGIVVSGGIGGSSAYLEGTLWGSGAWANGTDWAGDGEIVTGTVNIWGMPGFVDPDAGNYHLDFSSAAIDAGVVSGLPTDIDGDPRPAGAGYDIGADEFWGTRYIFYFPFLAR